MRSVVRFLVLAAVLLGIAYAIGSVPGTIGGTVGAVRWSTSMPVAIALALAAFVVLILLARVVATILRLPGRFGVAAELRRRRRGETALTASMLALASGEATDARREALRARKLLGFTPQTLLASAEADRAAGRLDGAEAGYRELADRPDTRFIGLRGLIGMALARGDAPRAAALFADAEAARPGTAWIRAERFALSCRAEDWSTARALAPDDRARAAFAVAEAEQSLASDPARAFRLARDAHKIDGTLAAAALLLARLHRASGREGRALAVLRASWTRAPQPELAAAALAPIGEPLGRVRAAEQFLARAPDTREGALLLGRLCLDAAMLGEARRHAERAAVGPGGDERRVVLLAADIAERDPSLSEPERRAAGAARLREAAAAPPGPAWHCERCGAEQVRWRPICPHCASAGRIGWTVTPRAVAPLSLPGAPAPASLLLGRDESFAGAGSGERA